MRFSHINAGGEADERARGPRRQERSRRRGTGKRRGRTGGAGENRGGKGGMGKGNQFYPGFFVHSLLQQLFRIVMMLGHVENHTFIHGIFLLSMHFRQPSGVPGWSKWRR